MPMKQRIYVVFTGRPGPQQVALGGLKLTCDEVQHGYLTAEVEVDKAKRSTGFSLRIEEVHGFDDAPPIGSLGASDVFVLRERPSGRALGFETSHDAAQRRQAAAFNRGAGPWHDISQYKPFGGIAEDFGKVRAPVES